MLRVRRTVFCLCLYFYRFFGSDVSTPSTGLRIAKSLVSRALYGCLCLIINHLSALLALVGSEYDLVRTLYNGTIAAFGKMKNEEGGLQTFKDRRLFDL